MERLLIGMHARDGLLGMMKLSRSHHLHGRGDLQRVSHRGDTGLYLF